MTSAVSTNTGFGETGGFKRYVQAKLQYFNPVNLLFSRYENENEDNNAMLLDEEIEISQPSTSSPRNYNEKVNFFLINFENLSLSRESDRLKTLKFWPCEDERPGYDKNIAAENGFYYAGTEDLIKCYFCNLSLNQWQERGPIKEEHARWSSQCPLLRNLPTDNVPMIKDEHGLIESAQFHPTNIRYITESSRLESYKYWPSIMKQKPIDLAKAGLYYSGTGDHVICFYCNGGLKDWEVNDDPWEEHAKWFEKCPFLIKNKGMDYIQTVQEKLKNSQEDTTPKNTTEKNENINSLPSNEGPKKSIDSDNQCRICYDNVRNVCFVPCGHVAVCSRCVVSLSSCPLCRKPYDKLVKIPFAQE